MSIHTDGYELLADLLKEARASAGLTQVQLAERLGQSQSFVSKMEVGQRRLDLVQLRTVCRALGTTLTALVARWDERLAAEHRGKKEPHIEPPFTSRTADR